MSRFPNWFFSEEGKLGRGASVCLLSLSNIQLPGCVYPFFIPLILLMTATSWYNRHNSFKNQGGLMSAGNFLSSFRSTTSL